MTNYRRLISYIYAYEGEVKGKNIGFAKLESRNGQCKLSINVKKVYVGSSDLGVYLLAPGKEIFLGNIFIRGGSGEFRAAVSVENVADSGFGMDLCYGLTIHEQGDNWRAYTTIWEDAVAHAAELELAEVTSESLTDTNAQIHKKVEELHREIEAEQERGEVFETIMLHEADEDAGTITAEAVRNDGGYVAAKEDAGDEAEAEDRDIADMPGVFAEAEENAENTVSEVKLDEEKCSSVKEQTLEESGISDEIKAAASIDTGQAEAIVENICGEGDSRANIPSNSRMKPRMPMAPGMGTRQPQGRNGMGRPMSGPWPGRNMGPDTRRLQSESMGAEQGKTFGAGMNLWGRSMYRDGLATRPENVPCSDTGQGTDQMRELGMRQGEYSGTPMIKYPEALMEPGVGQRAEALTEGNADTRIGAPLYMDTRVFAGGPNKNEGPEEFLIPDSAQTSETDYRGENMWLPENRSFPKGPLEETAHSTGSPEEQPFCVGSPEETEFLEESAEETEFLEESTEETTYPTESPEQTPPITGFQEEMPVMDNSGAERSGNYGNAPQENTPEENTTQKNAPDKPVVDTGEEELALGDPRVLERLEQEEQEYYQPRQIWDGFRKRYPKILAFDSANGCEILSIKPQDIGLLPRENWNYGNNSFLLHGYYNYRYLILARIGEDSKGRVRHILGVPGHYYSNEKYMASMFGFPHFVLSKKQPSQDGRFGYWYTDVRLENQD